MASRLAGSIGLTLAERLRGLHWPFVLLVALIGLVGYAVLYSAAGGSSEPWAWRHALRLGVGIVAMLGIATIELRFWYRWAYLAYGTAFALLLGVEIMGELSKGAQRWIDLGVIQLQPSELMKIALVLALARYFHGAPLSDVRRPLFLLPALMLILAPVGLVLKQPDLGTAVMLLGAGGGLLFAAGLRWWKIGLVAAAVGGVLPVAWSRLHDYQRQRVLTFLDPENDPLGSGYHIIQSKIALGSAGFWGKGYLRGTQAQLSFLPEKQTDFAFTLLAEESGFLGAALVLALYGALILIALMVALRAQSHFGRLLALGIGINFSLYVLVNVAMVTGAIPVVGVPLPMISYGGTAMLTVLLGFGLLLAVDLERDQPIARFPAQP